MKRVVVLTGAGVSKESGIKTFREAGGLWEEHRIEDVASPHAWVRDMEMVLRFYNMRRKQLLESEPNDAHYALVKLEEKYDVRIITQNIDDLHERAGSAHVMHLHGELRKSQSTVDPNLVYDIKGWELNKGDLCEKGSQLRPHVVWFGESVPMIVDAAELTSTADIYLVIGTSLNVYPAAGLVDYVPRGRPIFLVDPAAVTVYGGGNITYIRENAGTGVPRLVQELLAKKSI